MRRGIGIFAALAISVVVALLALSATANAQEAPPDGTPNCPAGETCAAPEPPCAPDENCTIPACPPDVLCTGPIGCPTDEPCSSPGDPGCPPEGTVCADPPPCDIEGGRECEFDDTDGDGWLDFTEEEWGSSPNDASSTPEHGYIIETCMDGVDNDGDGSTDLADSGCRIDSDEDGLIDAQDNCPWDTNADQADRDGDGTGDACDYDADNDGWDDFTEAEWGSSPNDANSTPEHGYILETCMDGADNDGDGSIDLADAGCNIDSDGDGRIDAQDNCPWDANADQADTDADGTGDACDYDADNDGWDDFTEAEWGSNPNDAASTPEHWFAFETCGDGIDNDADGSTDAADPGCAPDNDYDGVADAQDNCPMYWNPEQADNDSDGLGDACEDNDGDGFFDGDETAWGSDPADPSSTPEGGINYDACTDGIDNDRDGTLDGDDEGCRIMFEDGSLPPSASGPGQPVPVAVRDTTKSGTTVAGLPAAGTGPSHNSGGSSWWLIAASVGALAIVSGASIYGVRVRQRS